MGKKTVQLAQAFDGETWWQILPGARLCGAAGDPRRRLVSLYAEQADIDGPLVDAREKGHEVELIGREELDGKPVFKLKLTRKGDTEGEHDDYYIDAKSWQLVRVMSRRTVMGTPVTQDTIYSDLPQHGRAVVRLTRSAPPSTPGNDVHVRHVDKIEINIDTPDERFSFEAAKQAAAASASAPAREALPDGPVANDPAARALYDQMIAAFRAPNTLSFDSEYSLNAGSFGVTCSYQAWLKKPNYFRVEATGLGRKGRGRSHRRRRKPVDLLAVGQADVLRPRAARRRRKNTKPPGITST